MFKSHLTYSFAQNLHLSCRSLEIDPVKKERLLRSVECMMLHLTRFMHATADAHPVGEEMRLLYVSLTCLRDAKETFDETVAKTGPMPEEMQRQYDYVHARLERLCLDASGAEGGQMRMLG